MLPIGLQLYSVRNEMEKDFEGTLAKVADMGYEGVEFAGLFGHSPHAIQPPAAHATASTIVPITEPMAPPFLLSFFFSIFCTE